MKVSFVSLIIIMTLFGKPYLDHSGSDGSSTVACLLFLVGSFLFSAEVQKSAWKRARDSGDEPNVESRKDGGCEREPVGTRSGIRARGSVHAWLVTFQMAHKARTNPAGLLRTGDAFASESLSGEKVLRRACSRATSSVGE